MRFNWTHESNSGIVSLIKIIKEHFCMFQCEMMDKNNVCWIKSNRILWAISQDKLSFTVYQYTVNHFIIFFCLQRLSLSYSNTLFWTVRPSINKSINRKMKLCAKKNFLWGGLKALLKNIFQCLLIWNTWQYLLFLYFNIHYIELNYIYVYMYIYVYIRVIYMRSRLFYRDVI